MFQPIGRRRKPKKTKDKKENTENEDWVSSSCHKMRQPLACTDCSRSPGLCPWPLDSAVKFAMFDRCICG